MIRLDSSPRVAVAFAAPLALLLLSCGLATAGVPVRSAVRHAEFRDFVLPLAEPARSADAGIVLGIDPESGTLGMPTHEQMTRLLGSRTSVARPAPVLHSDGSRTMLVRSWMRDFAIARVGANGGVVTGCFEDRTAAMRALHAPPPASAHAEEE